MRVLTHLLLCCWLSLTADCVPLGDMKLYQKLIFRSRLFLSQTNTLGLQKALQRTACCLLLVIPQKLYQLCKLHIFQSFLLPVLYFRLHTRAGFRIVVLLWVLFKGRLHFSFFYHEFSCGFPSLVDEIFLVIFHGGVSIYETKLYSGLLLFSSQAQAFANPGLLPLCQS